ncbi:MAG: hypothetical protein QOF66_6628 [Mycobacterium sp.]|nr:hypothetical protein [Mycobacterium sp.]
MSGDNRITKTTNSLRYNGTYPVSERRDLKDRDQCGFHLGGGDAVPGDVHDVVDAAEHPDLAVAAVAGAVAGEVPALRGGADQ